MPIPMKSIRHLYAVTEGKAWEPPDPKGPAAERLVSEGWVERCDGRCGFEAFKDSMLRWTVAAHAALQDASEASQVPGRPTGTAPDQPTPKEHDHG